MKTTTPVAAFSSFVFIRAIRGKIFLLAAGGSFMNRGIYNRLPCRYLPPVRKVWWLSLLAFAVGCSNQLETGYKPQSLGASSSLRRSYYASPFTPESQNAGGDRDAEIAARRPRPGA